MIGPMAMTEVHRVGVATSTGTTGIMRASIGVALLLLVGLGRGRLIVADQDRGNQGGILCDRVAEG